MKNNNSKTPNRLLTLEEAIRMIFPLRLERNEKRGERSWQKLSMRKVANRNIILRRFAKSLNLPYSEI